MQLYKAWPVVTAVLLVTGCAGFGGGSKIAFRVYEQTDPGLPSQYVRTIELPKLGVTIPVDPYPVLTERDVQAAEVYPTADGDAILVRFDIVATLRLEELTTRNRQRYLVVLWDERPISAWLVNRPLTNGQWLIAGDFTDEEAARIVRDLVKTGQDNADRSAR